MKRIASLAKLVALLSAVAVSPLQPFGESGSQGSQTTALVHVESAQALQPAYALPVSEVPPPPRHTRLVDLGEPVCPAHVRAIVRSDQERESFAVLALGEESRIVRVGDKGPGGEKAWVVMAIKSDCVMLRQGDLTLRCALSAQ